VQFPLHLDQFLARLAGIRCGCGQAAADFLFRPPHGRVTENSLHDLTQESLLKVFAPNPNWIVAGMIATAVAMQP
jgi:hypothetical protein